VTAVLWAQVALSGLAAAWAVRLLWRTGEMRVAVLAVLAVLLGLAGGALLAGAGGRPLAADATSAAALAALGAAAAAVLAVRAFAATLDELELAEALHWGSMQGVRAVTELAAEQRGKLDERLAALLELGCERFGLEVGIVSRVHEDRYEIRALRAAEGFPAARGEILSLAATVCRHTFASERPVAVERIAEAAWARPSGDDPLGFEVYLGAPVTVGGRLFGTLAFASRSRGVQRFTASHKDLVALMAQTAGVEIERELAQAARDAGREAPVAMPPPGPHRLARRAAAGADLHAVLRRVEHRIRDLVEPRVRLVVKAGAGATRVRNSGVPLESLILTLVGYAVEAMPTGGTLTLAAGSLAGEGARYATLAVSHTGRGPDAAALARAFGPGPAGAGEGLALAGLVRALRRGGGDLSVEVDPSRGATFTVFLPLAATGARPTPAPRAVPPAPPGH
jgi:signal transduction histidine kinase